MSFSMSLHIGVNQVDPGTYGAVPVLRSAVKDAEAMEQIAKDLEYQDRLILRNNEATVSAVLARLGAMAQQVEPGGVVMVTFAGHGSEVPDDTGDEQSGRDQTWVLYDKMLIDDQLRAMWGRFAPGVRIFFVSDSCHSGSVARNFNAILESLKATKRQFLVGTRDFLGADVPTERSLPPEAALKAFEKYESEIVSTQWTCGNRGLDDIRATVISLTACQDDEVAGDGVNNGLFTGALLQVWNNGQFSGNSEQLMQAVAGKIRMYQRPLYTLFGATNPGALAQKPFAIATSLQSRELTGVRSSRVQRAKDLLAANGVYPQGCSGFVCDVLQISWESANALMGSPTVSAGPAPPYTGLSAGDIVGWQSPSGSGHVAVYIGEPNKQFIDVREPGANSRPRIQPYGYGKVIQASSRF